MLQRIRSLWVPGAYHGRGQRKVFFEGWYFKLVNLEKNVRLAVIPGVYHHPDPTKAHAFIQVLDGITSQVNYHRYPVEVFWASRTSFNFIIERSHFSISGCRLDIEGIDQQVKGELVFENPRPWPVRFFSPGVMGVFGLVPFMQTYHGVLSLDHLIRGDLQINQQIVSFDKGRGYIEKDWGRTFPRAYIWMQSNHFSEPGISFTASVATIPWMGSWFRGFLIGILLKGELYRFATYLGSKILQLTLTDTHVTWVLRGGNRSGPHRQYFAYELIIHAERGNGGLLSSPELDGMTPRILESLTAEIALKLSGLDRQGNVKKILFQGNGECAGLEVAGSVAEILDLDRDKEYR